MHAGDKATAEGSAPGHVAAREMAERAFGLVPCLGFSFGLIRDASSSALPFQARARVPGSLKWGSVVRCFSWLRLSSCS
jgi:hypothetical protein